MREPRAPRPELWAVLAYVTSVLFLALLVYLGLRPGGEGPVIAYGAGRQLIGLLAILDLFIGVAWSLLRRPVLQRRRALPFLLLVGVIGVIAFPIPYPSSHEGHESAVCFRLPFEGEWTVFWGGETKEESLLAGYFPDRRWGLDFVVSDAGLSHRGEGFEASDYLCFGREVLAPADGKVVRAQDGAPDARPGTYDSRVEACGNYVVIQVAEREFVFLCHLGRGSIAVKPGQAVRAGEPIGRVGTSGFSTVTPEPHLAIHLQDTPEPGRGEAVPWSFCDYVAAGIRVERGLPRGGIGPGGRLRGERVQPVTDVRR